MTRPEKVDLKSMDVAAEKLEQLRALLPEVFAEGKIDWEQLQRVLGKWVEPAKERFGLNWPGKAECMKVIQQPSVATLKPVPEESVDFDSTENLFIEGDNLEVLKLLQKSYFGKVKMIYIDPPYNTGKEFIYPDKYAENLDTYLAYTGQIDADGRKFATNTDAVGRYHSNWLNMMYPRLYLARNLLTEDGVIFISIDDNEQANLKMLCDQIFGEDNFIASLVWQSKKGGGSDNNATVTDHEYVLCYAKNVNGGFLSKIEITAEPLDREDEKGMYRRGRELNKWGANSRKEDRPTMYFPISGPNGEEVFPILNDGILGRWRKGKKKMLEIIANGDADFVARGDGTYTVYEKVRSEESRQKPYRSWLKDVSTTADGSKLVKALFDGNKIFDFPKPLDLIQLLVEMGTTSSGDIVLDFFAGSGTTAHAVLEQDKLDELERRFILIQLPEVVDENDEAYKKGYKFISDISKERIRRAAKKIAEERVGQLDLEGDGKLDLGFRVFKLDRSNFKVWEGSAEALADDEALAKQLEMHVSHVQTDIALDILYELLLKAGYPLTTPVEKRQMAGKDVFAIEGGSLLICLDKDITTELVDALADANPTQVICLDEGFHGNDQLKANAVQTFKARAQKTEREIVFRTV